MQAVDPRRPFRQLARNALLANRRLYHACAALPEGGWGAPGVSFFPSIKATLNHILVVDRFYLDAIAGGTLGPAAWADPLPCATPEAWIAAQGEQDRAAVDLCEAMVPGDLAREVRIHRAGRVQVETLADTLMHLFLHDQHHRGQVHAMLAGTSVKPPQLDEFFMADDTGARADDLSQIARDEAWLRR